MARQKLFIFGLLAGFGQVAGCAHGPSKPGVVTTEVKDQFVYVVPGDQQLRYGEKVVLYEKNCEPSNAETTPSSCEEKPITEGKVASLPVKGYAVVKIPPGFAIADGTLVRPK